jgi:hypothetical protein
MDPSPFLAPSWQSRWSGGQEEGRTGRLRLEALVKLLVRRSTSVASSRARSTQASIPSASDQTIVEASSGGKRGAGYRIRSSHPQPNTGYIAHSRISLCCINLLRYNHFRLSTPFRVRWITWKNSGKSCPIPMIRDDSR